MEEELLDKRETILRATLELIAEQGFHATPMSQIAKKANVSAGTIYYYFKSKEDLINAIYIDKRKRLTLHALKNFSNNASVQEGFKQLLGNVISYFVENPAELSFAEQYENSPLISATTREEEARMIEPIEVLFKRASEQNLLKELPHGILYALFIGSVISLAKFYLTGEVELNESSLTASINAIWDMIKR